MRHWLLVLGVLISTACTGQIGPEVSNTLTESDSDTSAPDSPGIEAPDLPRPGDPDPDPIESGACDIVEVLSAPRNGCTSSGCHGAQFAGGLDLASPEVGTRLVGVPSTTDACRGTPLIDHEDPQSSLLLLVIDPERYAEATDPCSVPMPLGRPGVSPEDVACFEAWVDRLVQENDPPPPLPVPGEDYEPVPVESYLSKLKGLLVGGAVTEGELARVTEDPTALDGLVAEWIEQPQFASKMHDFFEVALQQRLVGDVNFEDQLDRIVGPNRDEMQRNAEASFAMTAWRIVDQNRSFSEVSTTQQWMMTTALLSMLLYTEQTPEELEIEHVVTSQLPEGAPDPVTLRWMADNRTWYVPGLREDCQTPSSFEADDVLDMMAGQISCRNSRDHRQEDMVFQPSDFTDWRPVTLRVATNDQPIEEFYDVASLRGVNEVWVRIPRAGFFTTPAFLANWQTNADNQFRVSINQALITALGASYSVADQTPQPNADGLFAEHAEPETACYGCHRSLDPMRLYFMNVFTESYRWRDEDVSGQPNFAFGGVTEARPGLPGLAETFAEHPRFPAAWVQKLCRYANSTPCDESDPEFRRVVQVFVDSGLDFKALVRALFSSPLVTGATYVPTFDTHEPVVSITRTNHLCQILDERLETEDACSFARSSLGLLPDDEFVRGSVHVIQTADTSSFHFAAAEQVCTRIANQLVRNDRRYRPSDPETETIPRIVEELMGLPPGHSRRDVAEARLSAHFEDARAAGASRQNSLRSVFVLACQSPEVMALGL